MHKTLEHSVTVFFADEDGTCPFKTASFVAVDDTEAKAKAQRWLDENKPQHYRAVKIRLRLGETEIWSSAIDNHGVRVVAGR